MTKSKTETPGASAAGFGTYLGSARQTTRELSGALGASGKAYVGGILELGRTLGGFGREVLTEAGEHIRATFQARNVREVAELQAAWAQRRIETAATHAKEFADLARVKSEDVIAPLTALLKPQKAA